MKYIILPFSVIFGNFVRVIKLSHGISINRLNTSAINICNRISIMRGMQNCVGPMHEICNSVTPMSYGARLGKQISNQNK